ncbi:TolB family protein [Embleya sp. NBC_00896]|uniref:TolB family protein n=1 Tax=Embleya sp. NBC_00896 TaxID=2975961 RepID=UPI00386D9AB8|nr:TolB-like translocation protein [Embleya sp. NBC_00896]
MTRTARVTILAVVTALLVGLAVVYTLRAAGDAKGEHDGAYAALRLDHAGRILFRSTAADGGRDHLAAVDAARPGDRAVASRSCLVFHAARGTGVCLQPAKVALGTYDAVILDADLREKSRHALAGTPSRTRVSPSGRLAAWTSFVNGESYAGLNFSTRTAILDTRTGRLDDNLEKYTLHRGDEVVRAPDVNIWGVTFAADDNTFYATVATGGHTYLARGDVATRTLRTIRENAECPSLSPDGTRVVYKKRVPGLDADRPWHLYVLNLTTLAETPLAETRTLDDQAEWLDDGHVAYSLPGDLRGDIWTTPADGTGHPTLLIPHALSPAVLRN